MFFILSILIIISYFKATVMSIERKGKLKVFVHDTGKTESFFIKDIDHIPSCTISMDFITDSMIDTWTAMFSAVITNQSFKTVTGKYKNHSF